MRSEQRLAGPHVRASEAVQERMGVERYAVSVVIPALNEAENLPFVLPRIPGWVDEVVLVDGHSTDGTVELARRLRPTIRVVVQKGRGKGAALRSGFAAVTGDIVVMLDADGSTNPAEIPVFVGALLAGADMAKGSRFIQGGGTADMTSFRRWGNRCLVRLVRMLFGGKYSDLCYGYIALWADAIRRLDLDADGFEIETLMNVRALRAGLTVAEVPSFEAKRVFGTGRLRTMSDGWRVLRVICREWVVPWRPGEAPRDEGVVVSRPLGGNLQGGSLALSGVGVSPHSAAPLSAVSPRADLSDRGHPEQRDSRVEPDRPTMVRS